VHSRRDFLTAAGLAATGQLRAATPPSPACRSGRVSLDGAWEFRLDSEQRWREVTIPHTWQIEADSAEYYGVAWYRRTFEARKEWASGAVRIEFEAVFHSATVWINDQQVGEHLGKGYTAFAFDITGLLRFDEHNTVRVRVDNAFDDRMLPRGRSSDWAHDGGIHRPVSLLVTPKVFVERVEIDAEPDLAMKRAEVRVRALIRNLDVKAAEGTISPRVVHEATGLAVAQKDDAARYSLKAGEAAMVEIPPLAIDRAEFWHFDHPHLYELQLRLSSGHAVTETFGVRKIESRDSGFYLNGERVRLVGVERMAGSNPEYGMAEPASWIEHDHADMKELNCVYTRVHWQQDRRVLDYCDRHGILIQTEVPTWGPQTFAGMEREPSEAIMRNGLEQLREMIARDRNHPCIFSWGVSNEIGGQNPPAYAFAKRMHEEAKKLDPKRLVTYASNSLQQTPEKDVAGLMDYVMWNEYYESWFAGTPADLARNLDEIHRAFPGKAIVISEYGYCACTADRPEGDARRMEILREHNRIFRERDFVSGLVFFCYNDYRTHIGDKGLGVMKQRVHGVVDVYGARKPSFEALRSESSPVESVSVAGQPAAMEVTVRARKTAPAYTLAGYTLRAVLYGYGEIPLERLEAALPQLAPGEQATLRLVFREKAPLRIQFDVVRPTGFSAYTRVWRP
jgi:beta-glucuronidase